jgi:hypothetical protein
MKKILLIIAWLLASSPLALRADDGTLLVPTFQHEVDLLLEVPEQDRARYAQLLASALASAGIPLIRSQYVVMVDRNPNVQAIFIYWLNSQAPADNPSLSERFRFIGATPVSSGKPGRFDYFTTPLGVFAHSLNNKDFRAEGTFNVNHIRGLGRKGMRVFDFGWAEGERGWGSGGTSQMRLMIHATDPDYLEQRLGVVMSKGCIRIPATLNSFIDRYGILDADYQLALANGEKFWVLHPDRTPTPWSGRYLVIVDSASTERPAWAPKPAARRHTQGQ